MTASVDPGGVRFVGCPWTEPTRPNWRSSLSPAAGGTPAVESPDQRGRAGPRTAAHPAAGGELPSASVAGRFDRSPRPDGRRRPGRAGEARGRSGRQAPESRPSADPQNSSTDRFGHECETATCASCHAGHSGPRHRPRQVCARHVRHPGPIDPAIHRGGTPVAEAYRAFGVREARGVSRTYESWAIGVSEDPVVADLLTSLPRAKRQPNLVFAAARWHGARGAYDDFRTTLLEQWPQVRATILARATQTNEANRCAVLLPWSSPRDRTGSRGAWPTT